MLGTSRGPQDVGVMVDFLERERIDMLFCVGGDGTHRGAHAIFQEVTCEGWRSPWWASQDDRQRHRILRLGRSAISPRWTWPAV